MSKSQRHVLVPARNCWAGWPHPCCGSLAPRLHPTQARIMPHLRERPQLLQAALLRRLQRLCHQRLGPRNPRPAQRSTRSASSQYSQVNQDPDE